MSSFEERIKQSHRRGSAIAIISNPIDTGLAEKPVLKIENLSESRQITDSECEIMLEKLKACGNNESILSTLETDKSLYLFSSDSLARILTCTTSVKTRLAIILAIAPRLTDPRAKAVVFMDMFRFSEEKAQVEEAFKARIQSMNGTMFKKESSSILNSPAGRGGRGRGAALSPGRGDTGGRGVGISMANKPRAVSLPSIQLSPEMVAKSEADRAATAARTNKDSDDDSDADDDIISVPASHRPFSIQLSSPVSIFAKTEEHSNVHDTISNGVVSSSTEKDDSIQS